MLSFCLSAFRGARVSNGDVPLPAADSVAGPPFCQGKRWQKQGSVLPLLTHRRQPYTLWIGSKQEETKKPRAKRGLGSKPHEGRDRRRRRKEVAKRKGVDVRARLAILIGVYHPPHSYPCPPGACAMGYGDAIIAAGCFFSPLALCVADAARDCSAAIRCNCCVQDFPCREPKLY